MIHDPARVLCVCAGGNVRSASIALELKLVGIDAVPIGLVHNGREVLELLSEWADLIWIAEDDMRDAIPEAARDKLVGDPIGPDVWGAVRAKALIAASQRIAGGIVRKINNDLESVASR